MKLILFLIRLFDRIWDFFDPYEPPMFDFSQLKNGNIISFQQEDGSRIKRVFIKAVHTNEGYIYYFEEQNTLNVFVIRLSTPKTPQWSCKLITHNPRYFTLKRTETLIQRYDIVTKVIKNSY